MSNDYPENKKDAFLGIDPGKKGATCLIILLENKKIDIRFFDWPKDDDLFKVYIQLKRWNRGYDICSSIIERAASRPLQSSKATFTFGVNFGSWKAFLSILEIRHSIQTPQQWQKGLIVKTDGDTPKNRAQAVVNRLYPEFKDLLYGTRGGYKDGRGDALLIARKAMENHFTLFGKKI